MSWYRTGTVTVTNGSTTVTGSGTAWVANSRVGDAFVGPDGLTYEITNIASNTAISILPAYRSASGSGQSYSIIPVQGYTKTLADQASDLVNNYDKPWNVADDAADARAALGLGTASVRNIGEFNGGIPEFKNYGINNSGIAGNIELKFGAGSDILGANGNTSFSRYIVTANDAPSSQNGFALHIWRLENSAAVFAIDDLGNAFIAVKGSSGWSNYKAILSTSNTTVDSNGFIKQASPIVKLFSDKVDFNSDSEQQRISFVVNGIGDYSILGTTGFAQEGWYIETPKDSNGNIKCFVEYEQIAQSDGTYNINVKTFEPDYSEGPAKAGVPKHIPEGRWIDIRLQPLTASDQGDQVGSDGEN
ncbi:hypothetical protein [Shewanella algae]|uniref:phage tail fiber protein n=1 Tax=Shewanella algae TaxID=38313 RepID=UPI001AADBE1F|nr:hypothetical protein [Shewanella algae]MBO2700758.1 hypothetical protein [Shewanella algae]